MYGSWVLLVIIFISSLPVIIVFIWFRTAKYEFSIFWFLFALLAGAATFFPALLLQDLLAFPVFIQGRTALLYEFFIRIAFTEEISRLLMLFIFFWIYGKARPEESSDQPITSNIIKKATAAGLIAGLGFSILESARYAASNMDINIALLRIFTAALHGACGSRIGAATVMFRSNPIQALLRIITATAIHGIYNFLIIMPGLLSIAAILIAVSALITAILIIRGGWSSNENSKYGSIDKKPENI